MRLYWGLTFVWSLIVWLALILLVGKAGLRDIATILCISAIMAFYMSWLVLGSLGRWDERWRHAIEEGRMPSWVGWFRLVYVILPYYLFGWVPEKLLESHLHRYLLEGESRTPKERVASELKAVESKTPKERVASELKAAARQALKAVWREDLYLCSKGICDITKSLVNAAFTEEANIAVEEALKVIPRIREQEESSRLDQLLYVFRTLVIVGRTEDALNIAQHIEGRTGVTFSSKEKDQILRFVSSSLAEDVKDFERAVQVARQITDNEVRDYALGDICEALAEIRQVDRALKLTQEISDKPPLSRRAFTLVEICQSVCRADQLPKAHIIAKAISEDAFRLEALLRIAEEFANRNQVHKAKAFAKEALDIPYKDRSFSLFRISKVLAQVGEVEEALEMARKIKKRSRYCDALRWISTVLAQKGQIEKALEIAYRLEDEDERSKVLSSISQVLAEGGYISKAQEIVKEIGNNDERTDALSNIAVAFAKQGDANQTLNIIHEFMGTEYEYKGIDSINTLVKTLAKIGKIDDAIRITQTYYDPLLQVRALAEIYSIVADHPDKDVVQEGGE